MKQVIQKEERYTSRHSKATMAKFLFIPLYESHLRVFMPLIKQLQKQYTTEPLVIFLERVHSDGLIRLLERYSLPYMKVALFPPSFKRGGKININDLNMRFMEKHTLTLFYTKRIIKGLFDRLDPAFVVVVNETYYADRFFLHEAEKRRIPSLSLFSVIPEGTTPAQPPQAARKIRLDRVILFLWRWLWSKVVSLYRKILVALGLPLYYIGSPTLGKITKVCVWNEYVRQVMIKGGAIAGKIVVTGSPAYDIIYHRNAYFGRETEKKIRRLLNIGSDREIILFTAQPFAQEGICTPEEQRRLTELVIETCAKFKECFLVIKLHPRETIEDYDYLKNHPLRDRFRLVTDEDADLYDLMYCSRLVLTQSSAAGASTTALEAVLFDKDLINLNLFARMQVDYFEQGAALNVFDRDKIYDSIEKALHDGSTREGLAENRRKFIAGFLPEFDGKATERVLEVIFHLLGK